MASTPAVLTIADHALLSAQWGWSGEADPAFWECFAPSWRQTLREGWSVVAGRTADEVRERLRREHQAEARPDLSRIHPSWWLRALKDETPAVQRAVVANAPQAIRKRLQAGLGLNADDLRTDRPALADALLAASSLWSERLVGDIPDRDDPPVIVALTRHDLRVVARLTHGLGLAKYAFARLEPAGLRGRDLHELREFPSRLGASAPQFEQQARHDVERVASAERHDVGRLGLVTIARLLDAAEPYRVRWALQHLPYPVGKFTRTLMSPRTRRHASLLSWESRVFGLCWKRIQDRRRPSEVGGCGT